MLITADITQSNIVVTPVTDNVIVTVRTDVVNPVIHIQPLMEAVVPVEIEQRITDLEDGIGNTDFDFRTEINTFLSF